MVKMPKKNGNYLTKKKIYVSAEDWTQDLPRVKRMW